MSASRYSTARVPAARALGAPSVLAGTYTGAELCRTCARPGAYVAIDLPSRVGDRLLTPAQMRDDFHTHAKAE